MKQVQNFLTSSIRFSFRVQYATPAKIQIPHCSESQTIAHSNFYRATNMADVHVLLARSGELTYNILLLCDHLIIHDRNSTASADSRALVSSVSLRNFLGLLEFRRFFQNARFNGKILWVWSVIPTRLVFLFSLVPDVDRSKSNFNEIIGRLTVVMGL